MSSTDSSSDAGILSPQQSYGILSRVIPILFKFGIGAMGIVAIAVGVLYMKQDKLLYFPEIGGIPRHPGSNPRRYRSPAEHKLPFENHMIVTEDGVKIHSWLLLHPQSKKERLPTIIFFHGNAGNIGLRLPNAYQMYHLLNANILMVEYRGYGDSHSSEPTERGLKLDAEAALRFLLTHPSIDPTRIFIFGRSLGGAVAFHLAQFAERHNMGPVAGLIVENTFVSIAAMVDVLMPFLSPLKSLVLRIGWDSGAIIDRGLSVPILYLSGGKDTLVPPVQMRELYEKSRKRSICARIHVVKDGTHNETWLQGGNLYWEKIRSFLAEATAISRKNSFFGSNSVSDGDLNVRDAVDVGMGAEIADNGSSAKSAIPIMPNNIIGMARELSGKKKEH